MFAVPAVADALSLTQRRRLAEVGLGATLVGALALANGIGLSVPTITAAVAVSVLWESLVSGAVRTAVVSDLDPVEHPIAAEVRNTTADLAARMDVPVPRVTIVDVPWAGVTVLEDAGPRLVASREALADLDREALRGVVAHELAHLSLGHLDRLDVCDAMIHVIGLSVAWIVFLHHATPTVALLGGGIYLTAAVYRSSGPMALIYLLGSVGIIFLPMALVAYADRCEELAADEIAAAHAGREAYARGLRHVTSMGSGSVGGGPAGGEVAGDEVAGALTIDERQGPFTRLTARHPTVKRRLERLELEVDADVTGTDS